MAPGLSAHRSTRRHAHSRCRGLRKARHLGTYVTARTPGRRCRPEHEVAKRRASPRSSTFVAMAVALFCGLGPHLPAAIGQTTAASGEAKPLGDGQNETLAPVLSKSPNVAWLHFRADSSSHVPRPSAVPGLGVAPATRTGIHRTRMAIATAGLVATDVAAYAHFHKVWWDHPRTGFHLYRGWRRTTGSYDLGFDDSLWHHVDKCGHIFSASLLSHHGAATARWVGFSPEESDWVGFALASLLMLEIEVYDGFFAEWGFSLGDLMANEIGAALPMLQRRSRFFRGLNVKFSYRPSGDPVYGRYALEDYGGMTFWLCVDTHMLLPPGARHYWPDMLDLALGYGTTEKVGGRQELYLALDVDLSKVPVSNPMLRAVVEALHAIHLPAPALQLRPHLVGHLCYF